MARILIIRFSAIGDVAMTIPVIHSLATQYSQHQITVLSRANMAALFKQMPPNVVFKGVDLKKDYPGIFGLSKLYKKLKAEDYDYIADFHDVLRSKYLRWRFCLNGKIVAHINKGRKEKKELTRPTHKKNIQLSTSFERYARVLEQLNMPIRLNFTSIYNQGKGNIENLSHLTGTKADSKWIGIAPFATHEGKIYPLEKMTKVIGALSSAPHVKIFLFGGGKKETEILSEWEKQYPSTVCIAGKLKWDTELALMSHLDVMLSMDSSNMHLASLVGTPVVSIWGATHPHAGFMGWKQSTDNSIQTDLPCRPCSIFGNKPCLRQDYACLQEITPDQIVNKLKTFIYV